MGTIFLVTVEALELEMENETEKQRSKLFTYQCKYTLSLYNNPNHKLNVEVLLHVGTDQLETPRFKIWCSTLCDIGGLAGLCGPV